MLVYPCDLNDIEHRVAREIPYMGIKSLFAPHALAAIAALTPEKFDVKIFDEAVHGPVEEHLKTNKYTIVGIHLTTNLLERCLSIVSYIRANYINTYTVAGGIGLSNITTEQSATFQTVFHGEAEETWPEFLRDFESGEQKAIYRKISHPDMTKVPIPRWDLIKDDIRHYAIVSIQTTRGCPFDCNFCNVIYTYGRKMRCKTIDQVIEEVKLLESLGVSSVFFADDNFAGNRKYTKEILRELEKVNNSFDAPITFMTQLDITVANDDELLELLADCNFVELMIGIETINPETLREMNKLQNLNINIPEAVKKIHSYGILVFAHMIIGSDTDTPESLKHVEDFFYDTGITEYLLHPLMAPPGTRLWYQLKKDSRLINCDFIEDDFTDIVSNIIPKKISRIEMMTGTIEFWNRMNSVDAVIKRAKTFVGGVTRKPKVKKPNFKGFWKVKGLVSATMGYYMLKASKEDRKAFFEVFRLAQKDSPAIAKRFIFLYTNYLMTRFRTKLYSEILKQQIEIEKNDPSLVVSLDSNTPIPENFLKHSNEIFEEAYFILRKSLEHKEKLYNAAVETITDYITTFGEQLTEFDSFQKKNLGVCSERVLNIGEWKKENFSEDDETILPADKPPTGFFKQMFNSLDNNIRFKKETAL